MFILI